MLPKFTIDGILPPGVHWATWDEIINRLGYNKYRSELLAGMRIGLQSLQIAGCRAVYIDGSFCTSKIIPGDFDICYDDTSIDWVLLDAIEPIILTFDNFREEQKIRFKGEFFPFSLPASPTKSFFEFFQIDKHTGNPKGIVGLKL